MLCANQIYPLFVVLYKKNKQIRIFIRTETNKDTDLGKLVDENQYV